jgi:hypothetical protein
MSVFDKPPEDVNYSDLERLKSAGCQESQYLDYKGQAYGSETKELVKDITAFANAYGGEIIVGIEEDGNGRPKAISGIPDFRTERTRYEQSAMTGCDPRIAGLKFQDIPVPGGANGVVIISIPRSSRRPHMVTVRGEDRFWRRHGRHTNRMSAAEIGESFQLSREYMQQSLDYVKNRMSEALTAEIKVPTLVLGALPALMPERPVNPTEVWARELLARPTEKAPGHFGLQPMEDRSGWSREEIRTTLRDLVRACGGDVRNPRLSLLRTGYIELRENRMLDDTVSPPKEVQFRYLAACCVDYFRLASRLHAHLGYEGEVLAFGVIVSTTGLRLRDEPILKRNGFDPREDVADVRDCPEVPNLVIDPWTYSTTDGPVELAQRFVELVFNAFGFDSAPSVIDPKYNLAYPAPGPTHAPA